MPPWSDVAHSLAAGSRIALQSGIALILRTTLLLSAALIAGWLLRRRDPRSRAGIYTLGHCMALAGLVLAPVPLTIGRGLITVSLPRPPEPSRKQDAMSQRGEFVHADVVASANPYHSQVGNLAPVVPTPPSRGDSDASGVHSTPGFAPPARGYPPPNSGGRFVSSFVEGGAGFSGSAYLLLAFTWAIGAVAWLIWLAIGQIRLNSLCRQARPCMEPRALAELEAQSRSLHIPCPALLVSPEAIGPFVTGLRRPKIVLGESLLRSMDGQALSAVLAHELHHIVSRDVLWTFLSRLLCALVWPQPLLWALARRWRDTSEEACDRAAIQQGCPPAAYARCLVTIAESLSSRSSQAAAGLGMAASKSALGRRVEKIMNHRIRNASSVSPLSVKITIAAFAITLLIASRIVTAQDASSRTDAKPPERAASTTPAPDLDKAPASADAAELSRDERDLYLREIAEAQHQLDEAIAHQKGQTSSPDRTRDAAEELRAKAAALDRAKASEDKATATEDKARALLEKQAKSDSKAERLDDYEREYRSQIDRASKRAADANQDFERAVRSLLKDSAKQGSKNEYEREFRSLLKDLAKPGAKKEYDQALNLRMRDAVKRAAEKAYDGARQSQDGAEADKRAAEKALDRARKSEDESQAEKRAAEEMLDQARKSLDMSEAERRSLMAREAHDLETRQSKRLDALELLLIEKQAELDKASQVYTPGHPRFKAAQDQVEALRKQIDELTAARNENLVQAQRLRRDSSGASRKMRDELAAMRDSMAALQATLKEQLNREREQRSQMTSENRALRDELQKLRRQLETLKRREETSPTTAK